MNQSSDSYGRLLAGRYRFVEQLGHGGMGTVWLAQDQLLDREVAVKELSVSSLPPEERSVLHSRMQQEARAAARIKHPGVVTVYDVLEESDKPWIVMELIDGQSLEDIITTEGTLLPRDAARVGTEVLAALDRAHQLGVLHRDVKPANVLLERSGRVVLTDFGIALFEGAPGLTRTGDIIGSPDYLAPERATGHRPGPPSDLWSLGATLYAAVEGQSPFHRTSTLSTLQAVLSEPLPEPRHAGPLAPVIESLLRKNPDERPMAAQAQHMLEEVAAGATPPPEPHPLTQVVTPEKSESASDGLATRPQPSAALPPQTPTRLQPPQGQPDAPLSRTAPIPTDSPPGETRPVRAGRRTRPLITLAVVLVAAIIGGLVWALTSKNSGSSSPPSPVARPSTSQSRHPTPTASMAAANQAKSLDRLLNHSAASRRNVVSAVNAVEACTSPASVSAASTALTNAAQERASLISELNTLDLSRISDSANVTTDLRSAWQHSKDADSAYAAWANTMENGGCTLRNSPHDGNYTAAVSASQQATAAKNAFVQSWNPIAQRYGLPTRNPHQL